MPYATDVVALVALLAPQAVVCVNTGVLWPMLPVLAYALLLVAAAVNLRAAAVLRALEALDPPPLPMGPALDGEPPPSSRPGKPLVTSEPSSDSDSPEE